MDNPEDQQTLNAGGNTSQNVVEDPEEPTDVIEITKTSSNINNPSVIQLLIAVIAFLGVIIIILIVLLASQTNSSSDESASSVSSSACTPTILGLADLTTTVETPGGDWFYFGHAGCSGYRDLWEDPSIPIEQRSQIGRGIFQTPFKMKQAMELIQYGRAYQLYRTMSEESPMFLDRFWNTSLQCGYYEGYSAGACQQWLSTNAIGNIGSQLDSFGEWFTAIVDNPEESTEPTNDEFVLFNNFKGSDVFDGRLGAGDHGVKYLGVENIPTLFTRCILIDVAGYKGLDILEAGHLITVEDIEGALIAQGLSVENVTQGDAVMVYTGWGTYYETDPEYFHDWAATPGLANEVVIDIMYPKNVMVLGSDTWGVDAWGQNNIAAHQIFLACGGGFNHELANLKAWAEDARNGDAPWMGAYLFHALPIEGAVGSMGAPIVFV